MLERIRVWLLSLLIIFLPLSAWLVSLTGFVSISLIRDALLFTIVITTGLSWRQFKYDKKTILLILLLGGSILVSAVNREDSLLQWLRGARYIVEPFILLLCLVIWPVNERSRTMLGYALLAAVIIVVSGGLLDIFWPSAVRYSFNPTSIGYLGQIHWAGEATRIQSVLAGPNALGLFCLVAILLSSVWGENVKKSYRVCVMLLLVTLLVLTYSRSSYVGTFVGFVVFLWQMFLLHKVEKRIVMATFIAGLLMLGAILILKPDTMTREYSNVVRLEQYQRVWNERSQIGWTGRGAGTAGLVSEYALDNSNNYYSENSYLNIYENIGLVGAIVYLSIWIWISFRLFKGRNVATAATASMAIGLFIAGVFIDHYTGQAAIWIALLFVGAYLPATELGSCP